MIPLLINPLPLLFTFVATFGVLVHDTQIDRATTVALALPTAFATFAAIDAVAKTGEQHLHVERVSMPNHLAALRASIPRLQARDDDRRYAQTKKVYFGGSDRSYIWPSI